MKRILYIALWSILLITSQAFRAEARQLSLEEALARASQSKMAKARKLNIDHAKLVHTESVGATNCFYIVNHSENRGFMVLSADDCAPAVLGYVDNGQFDPANVPANFAYFLDRYTQQIVSATRMNRTLVQKAPAKYGFIPTIIEARWNQGEPYNRLCTDYTVLSEPVVTGCVATAISQIMRQYKWPVRGKGSHSYTTKCEIDGKEYTIHPSANFDVEYEWDKMLFDYNNGYTKEEGDAVALLMRHVGVACNMGYNPAGSGAGVDTPIHALRTYFGYDKNMKMSSLSDYTDEAFANLLLEELSTGRAIYGAGNGHAFICDGYDGEGYFHWNWGWGGGNDGYFMLAGTDAVGGFRDGLCVITGIQPDQGGEAPTVMRIDNYTLSLKKITDYKQEIVLNGFLYNTSGKKVKVLYGVKFENENGSYTVPSFCTELDNGYGFTSYGFRCQNVPNGTYKVYPAYRDMETGEWHFPSCNPKEGIPTVTIDVPVTEIRTAQDLIDFRTKVKQGKNGCAVFMEDIDLGEVCCAALGSWEPIGSTTAPFKGRVEGNGHIIKNLFIRTTKDFQGLFGVVGDGTYISGLTLDASCNVRGGSYVGGIAGGSINGGFVTILDCGNEGLVYASKMNAAGIIGCCYESKARFVLENCYNAGNISGMKENGAISGWVGDFASVENCYNIARVGGNDGTRSFVRNGNHTLMNNCYQLNTVYPKQKGVNTVLKDGVANGELAYLLNRNGTAGHWFQQLDTLKGADEHPVLHKGSPWVYATSDSTFSNTPNDLCSIEDGKDYTHEGTALCSEVRYVRGFAQTEAWEPLFVPFGTTLQEWGSDVQVARIDGIHHYDEDGDGIRERVEMEATSLAATDSIRANTPYLIRSAQTDSLHLALHRTALAMSTGFEPTWCANARVKFCLQGVYAPFTTGEADYILTDNALKNGTAETIAPQRWYMYTTERDPQIAPQRISLKIDGSTATGISGIHTDKDGNVKAYDLLGRPMQQPTKGIYIRKGKKVLVK